MSNIKIKKIGILNLIKQYKVINFSFGLFLLNRLIYLLEPYFINKEVLISVNPSNEIFNIANNIWFFIISEVVSYFFIWLLIIFIASRFTKDSLKQKTFNHPLVTIIIFIIYITDLPYKIYKYGGNIISFVDIAVYYAFLFFCWWLLICWISSKIFKKQKLQWNWYKKIIEKIFLVTPIFYKIILGILVGVFLFSLLLILISGIFR